MDIQKTTQTVCILPYNDTNTDTNTEPQAWWQWDNMRRQFTTCNMYMRSFRPHWYKIPSLNLNPCQGSASHHAPHQTTPRLSPEWWDQVLPKRSAIPRQANQRLAQPGWGIHKVSSSEKSWVNLETWNLSTAMSDPRLRNQPWIRPS